MCPTNAPLRSGPTDLSQSKANSNQIKHADAYCDQAGFDFLLFAIDVCGTMDAHALALLSIYPLISSNAVQYSKVLKY
jgi:hypothetical protein